MKKSEIATLMLAGLALAPLVTNVDPKLISILTACLTVYVACYRSVNSTRPWNYWFPCFVWGMIIPAALLSMLLSITIDKVTRRHVFIIMGIYTIPSFLLPAVTCLLPSRLSALVNRWPSPCSILGEFTMSQILAGIISVVIGAYFCLWYAFENHWLPNNVFVIAFCIQQSQVLRLSTLKTSCMLLIVLFLFELHTESISESLEMVSAPKSSDYFSIMLMFPTADPTMPFYMPEILPILIPGYFIALILRFDISKDSKTRYFGTAFVAYIIGLVLTVTNWLQLKRGGVVYILPVLFGILAVHSTWNGDFEQLWAFSEGRRGNNPYYDNNDDKEEKELMEQLMKLKEEMGYGDMFGNGNENGKKN